MKHCAITHRLARELRSSLVSIIEQHDFGIDFEIDIPKTSIIRYFALNFENNWNITISFISLVNGRISIYYRHKKNSSKKPVIVEISNPEYEKEIISIIEQMITKFKVQTEKLKNS